MILDPNHYRPRKLSLNDEGNKENKQNQRKSFASKFDAFDPFLKTPLDIRNAAVYIPKDKRDSISGNTNNGETYVKKRNKAYSIHENFNFKNRLSNFNSLPLNKNYELYDKSSKLLFNIFSRV